MDGRTEGWMDTWIHTFSKIPNRKPQGATSGLAFLLRGLAVHEVTASGRFGVLSELRHPPPRKPPVQGLRVQCFRVSGSGFSGEGLGFRIQCLGFRLQGLGLRI